MLVEGIVGLVILLLRLPSLLLCESLQLLLQVEFTLGLSLLSSSEELFSLLLPVLDLLLLDAGLVPENLLLSEFLEGFSLDQDGVFQPVDLLELELLGVVEDEILLGELLDSLLLLILLVEIPEEFSLELEGIGGARVLLEISPLGVYVQILQVLRLPDVLLLGEKLVLEVLLLDSAVGSIIDLLENRVLDILSLLFCGEFLLEDPGGA